MFCSDRTDTEELYRNEVFKGIKLKSFTKIDEKILVATFTDEVSLHKQIKKEFIKEKW